MVNHVGGHGHPVAAANNQNNMELQQRNAGSANATTSVDDAGTTRQEDIGRIAHLLENYFPGGDEIRESLHQKATILHDEMGHKVDDVKATIAKAETLDNITSMLEGGANALGYALSGVPGDLIGKGIAQHLGLQPGTPLHDFATGMASGVTAVGMKAVLEKVLADSLKDTKWLQADADKLEPFMQDVMKKRDNALHKVGQAGMGGLGFDARNVITGGLSAGTQTLKENDPRNPPVGILEGATKPGYIANQSVGTVLTVAAGSMSGVVQNKYNKLHSPEFLFGRTDWKERYQALADTSVSGQLVGGMKNRVTTAAKDAMTLQKWGSGFANLVTINQLAEMVALGGGLGGTNIAKSAARDGVMKAAIGNMPTSPQDLLTNPAFRALREGAAQAANLPTAALAYFGQGLAGVGSTAAKGPMKNAASLAMHAAVNMYNNVRQAHGDNAGAIPAAGQGSSASVTGSEMQRLFASDASTRSASVTGSEMQRLFASDASTRPASVTGSEMQQLFASDAATRPASVASAESVTGSQMQQLFASNASTRPASVASTESVTGSQMQQLFASNASTRPASVASAQSVTGSEMQQLFASDAATRPASVASAESVTGSEMQQLFASNASTRPASVASAESVTGSEMQQLFANDAATRPASVASAESVTGSEMQQLFASDAATRPASVASTESVTGSEMQQLFASDAATRPASIASTESVTGSEMQQLFASDASTRPASSHSNRSSSSSQTEMLAQQMADRIGKMAPASTKS